MRRLFGAFSAEFHRQAFGNNGTNVTAAGREAADQGKSLPAHYAHLTVHGLLHLQGYDHLKKTEAVTMEAVESFIMQRLGFPAPYPHGR